MKIKGATPKRLQTELNGEKRLKELNLMTDESTLLLPLVRLLHCINNYDMNLKY